MNQQWLYHKDVKTIFVSVMMPVALLLRLLLLLLLMMMMMMMMILMMMAVMMMMIFTGCCCSPYYGYHRHEEPFLKIYLYSPLIVKKFVSIFKLLLLSFVVAALTLSA